jgi:hypothetical protein
MKPSILAFTALVVVLTLPLLQTAGAAPPGVPHFEPDPYWPKPLPNNWMLGQVSGIYVDSHDHIWVTSRPRTLDNNDKYAALNPPEADCCIPAPPIMEFDQAGNLVQGWGGPGAGYEWPDNEHGIFIDYKENVWVGGNSDKDTNILKFTKTGKFLTDRPSRKIGRQQRHRESEETRRNLRVSQNQRGLRGRWLRQPARHRFRCGHRRLQAALGRLWKQAR